jgi:NADP-dependent 3-hydroxy acid dehydrogenase YdfG
MELCDAVAVVTGASAGIGRATAWAFAGKGARVVASARRQDRLNALVQAIERRGGRALAVPCDVSRQEDVHGLRGRVEEAFGRCDVLVNNAGIPGGGRFDDLSIEQIEAVVRTNLLGVLYGTKAFLPMMLAAGEGHVVNVASIAGRFAVPGAAVYSATKHAVVAFSESLHFEVEGRGLLVTTVNPGLVQTEGFPHRELRDRFGIRPMKPLRIAEVIVEVVERGRAPEVTVPRLLGAMQAVRVLAPPVYRWGVRRAVAKGLRATRVPEA